MTLGVCGTVVTLYALLTLLPWIAVLHRLSQPM
jgi:hypothetical protein